MNRKELQLLANTRLREAQALLRLAEFSGAYYLAGYAIECGLKACIARNVERHTFPDKTLAVRAHTHDLAELAKLANLEQDRHLHGQNDPAFITNWDLITLWSEKSRYNIYEERDCQKFLDAVTNKHHGALPWVKRHW